MASDKIPVLVNISADQVIELLEKRGTLVDVVRCVECKHRTELTTTKWHPCVDMAVNDDWFCADGERKVQE